MQLVIIPTYNEIENISLMVEAVLELNPAFDILVVDDNSPDGTAEVVEKLMGLHQNRLFLLKRAKKDGLGMAYVEGFKWAIEKKYDYIFEMDADFSHNPNDLPRLLKGLSDADVVIGSRYAQGVNIINWPMNRLLMSFFANKYVRFMTGMQIADTTAGFVGYRRKVLETLNLDKIRFKGYGFQVEMKYKSKIAGFRIKEISIIFTERVRGESKVSKNMITEGIFGVPMLRIRKILGII